MSVLSWHMCPAASMMHTYITPFMTAQHHHQTAWCVPGWCQQTPGVVSAYSMATAAIVGH
jgi:hypothetical protein